MSCQFPNGLDVHLALTCTYAQTRQYHDSIPKCLVPKLKYTRHDGNVNYDQKRVYVRLISRTIFMHANAKTLVFLGIDIMVHDTMSASGILI
jgi:hypothetical protein